MLDFINGIIASISPSYVVIENNGIGFKVFTPNPYSFKEGDNCKVFLYNLVKEDEYSLYGFKTIEERELFLKLIGVKGLGPKIAIGLLASSNINGIIDAIDRGNILYLTKFPKVGDKLARQIILDLKGKLVTHEEVKVNNELSEALESLGYKKSDINRIIKNVDSSLEIEMQIKEALKLLIR